MTACEQDLYYKYGLLLSIAVVQCGKGPCFFSEKLFKRIVGLPFIYSI